MPPYPRTRQIYHSRVHLYDHGVGVGVGLGVGVEERERNPDNVTGDQTVPQAVISLQWNEDISHVLQVDHQDL